MARLRDEDHRECYGCGKAASTPVYQLNPDSAGMSTTACPHCGVTHLLQFRPPADPTPAEIAEQRAKLRDEIDFQRVSLHIVQNRPKLLAGVWDRIAELEGQLALLGAEAA